MASSPRRQRSKWRLWRQSRQRPIVPGGIPWGWMFLTGLLYAAIGMIMAALPAPYWIWSLAIGGAIAQALALAGPIALSRFIWWKAQVLTAFAILGAVAVAIALGTALGYVGTDNLDDIELSSTAFQVLGVGLLALVIAASTTSVTGQTGDRLLISFNRLKTTLLLSAISITGLGIGTLLGFLIGE
jgi:hypothetical protein